MSVKDPVIEKIIVARVGLLLRHPFFGNLATRMRIVDATEWTKTAATDFRHLYYNRDFISKLSNREVEFVVAHEIYHCVLNHFLREESRNHKYFNVAADYAVNGLLVRDRIGDMPKSIKCYHDTKYNNWSAEQIYDDLIKKQSEDSLDRLGQLLDQHLNHKDDSPNAPSYSDEELRQIRDEITEAMIQAANAAGAGNVPGEIARMIKDMTEPKMNWRQLLRQQIQSTIKNDFSFARPNRKGQHLGAILPGTNFDTMIDVAVSIDMSGSISDQQASDFMSEIKGIMDEFKAFKMKVWCFDTRVYNEADFDEYCAHEIEEYQVKGGGGTMFEANWEYMKEMNINPKKFIMFTDGYPNCSWGDPDYCDTIFIIHGNNSIVPPFGQHAYYE